MLLLTGATGLIGSALLPRLTAGRTPVRCLVRDPQGLGAERVRVQIALGDLADPPSFRNAMRGVTTVVHLAASARDQPGGSIEELNAIATWRMVEAAERAGVGRFVFLTALGASAHDRTRFLRAKAVAEDAVGAAGIATTTVACSLVYAPGDRLLAALERLSLLPAVPLPKAGRALHQPIWSHDVADCLVALLERPLAERHERVELAGPETLDLASIAALTAAAHGRRRRVLPVSEALVRGGLRLGETLLDARAPITWDEAELLEVSLTSPAGARDARALGVEPRRLADVLGLTADRAAAAAA